MEPEPLVSPCAGKRFFTTSASGKPSEKAHYVYLALAGETSPDCSHAAFQLVGVFAGIAAEGALKGALPVCELMWRLTALW